MKKLSIVVGSLLLACGGSQKPEAAPAPVEAPAETAASAEAWRAEAPVGGAVPELRAPIAKKSVLPNGLTLFVVEKPELPLVHVRVVLMSGSAADPTALPGLAGFTGDMLKSGTKTRSATQIADEVETLGASLDVGVDDDTTSVSFTALSENYGPIFDVVSDVLTSSVFAPGEIEKVRKRRLAAIEQQKAEPSATASLVFGRVLYGEHPYGHTVLGDTAAVTRIKQKDLVDYFRAHFRPANAAVVVVGALTEAQAQEAVQKRLGAWSGKPGVAAAPTAPKDTTAKVVLVEKKDAPQSQLRIGELGVARSDPDYFKLVLMNAVLGGLFNSRINMNLREDKGYTYGARTVFDFTRGKGPFLTYTGVRTDVTAPAIAEIFREIDKMRTSDVTASELQNAKNSYSLSLPSAFQTVGAVASMMANLYIFDLPLNYYQVLPAQLGAVSVADVRAVAEKHLHPEKMSVVVVGDKAKVENALADLKRGPVEHWSAEGKPLK